MATAALLYLEDKGINDEIYIGMNKKYAFTTISNVRCYNRKSPADIAAGVFWVSQPTEVMPSFFFNSNNTNFTECDTMDIFVSSQNGSLLFGDGYGKRRFLCVRETGEV